MAKLYWTKDVRRLIEKKIAEDSAAIVNDKNMPEEKMIKFVHDLRIFRLYADELIEEMEELDREDDEYMASLKAKKADGDTDDNG